MSAVRSSLTTRCRSLALRVAVTVVTAASVSGSPAWATPSSEVGNNGSRTGIVITEPLITLAQRVEPQVVLRPLRDESSRLSAKGNDLWAISELGSFDVPEAALRAYRSAAASIAESHPSCQLPWTLLAGIGRVESDHGRYGGSVLGSDGVPRPAIRGIALDGVGPVAAIADSDNGRFDGDKVWDRAVGPMQFIPTTWDYAGRDGDGDGVASPNDIDDAALAAAGYLCPSSGSVLAPGAMESAIHSYNHSDYYVSLVMAFERGYRTGSFAIPSPPPPPGDDGPDEKRRGQDADDEVADQPRDDEGRGGKDDAEPGNGDQGGGKGGSGGPKDEDPRPSPGPKPDPKPDPKPTPKPSPTPTPTAPPEMTGLLTVGGSGWLLGGVELDFGPESVLAATASDYDRDGVLESRRDEITGLVGTSVTVKVGTGTSVVLLAGLPY